MIYGAVIGAIISIIIAELYHRRASRETQKEIDCLKKLSSELKESLEEVKETSFYTANVTDKVKEHIVRGTPDDPNYPYK